MSVDDVAGAGIAALAIAGLLLNLMLRLALMFGTPDLLQDGRCHICRRHVWPWRTRWAAWRRGEELPQPLYAGTRLTICHRCEAG